MAISQQREQRKRYRILLSSFSQEEKASLAKIIKDLGGIYLETPVRTSCDFLLFNSKQSKFFPPTFKYHVLKADIKS